MKAGIVIEPGRVEIEDIPMPKPGPAEALVKIEVCGLCGTTDRHLVEGIQSHHPRENYPAVLGHESVGVVQEIGSKVTSFNVGDRLTRVAAIYPGEARDGYFSAWGGFAEYGIVRDQAAIGDEDYAAMRHLKPPADLDPLDASLAISLSELGSWCWKVGALGGKAIAVGGTGLAGYAICMYAKLAGASPIIAIGRRDERIELAKKFGATAGVNITKEDPAEAVKVLNGGRGADYFAEATGADPMFIAGLKTLAPNGQAVLYGAPEKYTYTLAMKGAPGDFAVRLVSPEEYRAYDWVCGLIQTGRIDTSLFRSHVWEGLEALPQALEEQASGKVIKGFVRI
jgi:threonine dehydrogenase-like Zn-dependent dehydrogenase